MKYCKETSCKVFIYTAYSIKLPSLGLSGDTALALSPDQTQYI